MARSRIGANQLAAIIAVAGVATASGAWWILQPIQDGKLTGLLRPARPMP